MPCQLVRSRSDREDPSFSRKTFGAFQTSRTSPECLLLFSSRKAGTGMRVSQSPFLCIGGQSGTEADVVVRVRRMVPVAVRRTTVPGIVVPTAAAFHAVRTRMRIPQNDWFRPSGGANPMCYRAPPQQKARLHDLGVFGRRAAPFPQPVPDSGIFSAPDARNAPSAANPADGSQTRQKESPVRS